MKLLTFGWEVMPIMPKTLFKYQQEIVDNANKPSVPLFMGMG